MNEALLAGFAEAIAPDLSRSGSTRVRTGAA